MGTLALRIQTFFTVSALAAGIAAAQTAPKPSRPRAERPPRAAAPPVHVEPVTPGTRLLVRGVRGEIDVRLGAPGEIRWATRDLPAGGAGPEVSSTSSEGIVRIGPPGDEARTGCGLEIAVPPGVVVDVETHESRLTLTGLRSDAHVRGGSLRVEGRATEGRLTAAVQGGEIELSGVVGEIEIEGSELSAKVAGSTGSLRASLEGGTLVARDVEGDMDVTASAAEVSAQSVSGRFVLRAEGGSASASGLPMGGELNLRGAALKLGRVSGEVEIVSDADVQISESDASVRIDATGGNVRVLSLAGALEIVGGWETRISVSSCLGPVRVEGRGLKARLGKIEGEMEARLSESEIVVDGVGGEAVVENVDGPVTVSHADDRLVVRSTGGDVRLASLKGPVEVDADGPQLHVGWIAVPPAGDSTIRNAGGSVEVAFAGQGGASVDASTRSGKIRAALPGLSLSDEGRTARGRYGTGGGGSVRIEAEGDIVIRGGDPRAGEKPPPEER